MKHPKSNNKGDNVRHKMNKYRHIGKRSLGYLLLMVPYMLPGCISSNTPYVFFTWMDNIGNIMRVISASIIIFYYFKQRKKAFDLITWIFVYSLSMVLSSLITGGNIITSIVICVTRTTFCMLISIILNENRISIIANYVKTIIVINLVCMFIWPNGLYIINKTPTFFAGHKNVLAIYLVFSMLFIYLNHGKATIEYWIYLAIAIFTVVLGGSSTGIVMIILFSVLSVLPFKKINKVILNDRLIYIFTTIFSLVFTVSSELFLSNRYISNIIFNYFHKDLTLTTRTYLWEITWEDIAKSPIVGWGFRTAYTSWDKISPGIYNAAHNGMLQVLFSTGIMGMVLLFIVFYISSKKSSNICEENHIWINTCIFVLLLIAIMEPNVLTGHLLFVLLIVQYYSNRGMLKLKR